MNIFENCTDSDVGITWDGKNSEKKFLKSEARAAQQTKGEEEMREERWQGKLLNNRWEDDDLNTGCFDWLSRWKTAPSHTIADVHELYQQLLPTKLYHHKKTRTNSNPDVQCRLCGKTTESISYLSRLQRFGSDKVSRQT